MTLKELIASLAGLPDDEVICVGGGSKPSGASLAESRPRGSIPEGLKYVLEVELAKEVLDTWSRWRSGRAPTTEEALQAILYYSEHDAYQPI